MAEIKICEYGCGAEANYQQSNGKWCCSRYYSTCPKIKEKNSKGLKKAYKEGRKKVRVNQFKGLRNSRKGKLLLDIEDVFKKVSGYSTEILKKYIIYYELKEYKCEKCECSGEWLGEEIILELDHIDGDRSNNELENLRFLCPNCHSQTSTFRGRNINGVKKVTDEEIKIAITSSKNIRQTLIKVGLAPKGANYKRVNKIIEHSDVNFNKKYKKEKQCENPNCDNVHINERYCCKECYHEHGINQPRISQRKVERPPYEQLVKEIEETNYSAVGRKYGVSDNAIRKWVKFYEKNL